MKDGYRYQDEKVLVTDYSNNSFRDIQVRHYQDNIDEILITENVLEDLDKLYDSIVEVINEDNYNIIRLKNEVFSCLAFYIFASVVISSVLLLFSIKIIISLLGFGIVGGLIYKYGILLMMNNIKELEKKLRGNEKSLETVEREIEINQKKLKELEENITRYNLNNSCDNESSIKRGEYIQLDYVDKLKLLREYLGYCYGVGHSNYNFLRLYNIYDFNSFNEFIKNNKSLGNSRLEDDKYKTLKKEFTDRVL